MSTEIAATAANHPALSGKLAEQLRAQSKQLASTLSTGVGGGPRITGDPTTGKISVGELKADVIQLVVIDYITMRRYYDTPWRDGDAYRPPICYGVGKSPDTMKPHENVEEIGGEFQAESCADCALNEWGSDGAGKACKERRMLLCLPPDPEYIDSEFWQLSIPPTSLKSFDTVVRQIDEMWHVPPIGAIIDLSLKTPSRYVQFEFSNPEPNTLLEAHFARQEEAAKILADTHFSPAEEEQVTGNTRKPAARKKVARKKAGRASR